MQEKQLTLPMKTMVRDTRGTSYIVETLLGQGGFGAVYVVRDRRIKNKRFALKELIDYDTFDRECFLFEGDLLQRLDHPALPHVYSVFGSRKLKRMYMLMDYVEGRNLKSLLKEQPEQRFAFPAILELLAPIVDAISYLHQQDPPVIHRDIKPANIIVPANDQKAVLVDFGSAKEYDSDATTNVLRQVSAGYAAPEQYMGGTNPRTDVYGLGATIYTLLSGQAPPDALVRATRSKGGDPLDNASQVLTGVPTSIVKIIQKAMSLNSEDRYESVEQFWQQFQTHANQQGEADEDFKPAADALHSHTVSINTQKKRPDLKKSLALVTLLALLLSAAAGTGFLLHTTNAHSSPAAIAVQPTSTMKNAIAPPQNDPIYPSLAASYTGIVSDLMTKDKTRLILANIQQKGQHIFGTFQGLGLTGIFQGTVSLSGHVQFSVIIYSGSMKLVFEGNIKIGGDLAGSFQVFNQQGQYTGESGLWTATKNP